jgi:hypothetical protein
MTTDPPSIPVFELTDNLVRIPSYFCPDELHPSCDMLCEFCVYAEGQSYKAKNTHLFTDRHSLALGILDVLYKYKTRAPLVTAKIPEDVWAEILQYCQTTMAS